MAELNQQPPCNKDSTPISNIYQHLCGPGHHGLRLLLWPYSNGSGGGNNGCQGVRKSKGFALKVNLVSRYVGCRVESVKNHNANVNATPKFSKASPKNLSNRGENVDTSLPRWEQWTLLQPLWRPQKLPPSPPSSLTATLTQRRDPPLHKPWSSAFQAILLNRISNEHAWRSLLAGWSTP